MEISTAVENKCEQLQSLYPSWFVRFIPSQC